MISQRLINLAAAFGVLLGALSYVRSGSIILGAALLLTGIRQERPFERYLAMLIGLGLIVVAIVLPHGR
jgi:uncharacterized membrane protein